MAKQFTIEIEIDEEGKLQATVKGIKGKKCTEASKFLDQMGTVLADQPTAEMYQQELAGQTVKQGQ